MILTSDQLDIATESYAFWRGKRALRMHACALTACEGGETGFKWALVDGVMRTAPGDHGEAKGIFQWHAARSDLIFHKSGYDVVNGTHGDMLNGAYAEMTEAWSAYRKVWPALMATTTLWSAMTELVVHEEQSASQASDVLKRTGIAVYLDHIIPPDQAAGA